MKCQCCGDEKGHTDFSYVGGKGYADKCKECNLWLRLLAAAFGPSRLWHENRKKTSERMKEMRRARAAAEAPKTQLPDLYEAFGMQLPEERNETTFATRLANAPWPYRSASGVCGVSVPEDNRVVL